MSFDNGVFSAHANGKIVDGKYYVFAKFSTDDPKHAPSYQTPGDLYANLRARIVPTMVGGIPTPPRLLLNHRSLERIKTNVRVQLPENFRLCVAIDPKFANRGLAVITTHDCLVESCMREVVILVINVGREIIEVRDGDIIAQCWAEQVFRCEWEQLQTATGVK